MNNNFTIFAQNNENDYVKQAYLCALSIRATNPNSKVCLITNENVEEKYKQVFDDIVDFPWGDHAADEEWKIHNRWKIYHATPYKEGTAVIDSDMLVLQDLSSWFTFLEKYDLFFANGGDQNNNSIPEANVCKEKGIGLIDGLGKKIQSSSWLLKK